MSFKGVWKFMGSHPLTRDRRAQAFARYLKWQIHIRLAPAPIVYDWINGAKFLVSAGETGLTGNVYTGLHEFAEMGYLLHVIRSRDLFVDVGANVGSYTILACAVGRAQGLAIEPVPSTYERLVGNIRLNDLEHRVNCMNLGVGEKNARMSFTADLDTANHVVPSSKQTNDLIEVEIRALDDLLQGACPSVMKMDVEGYETPALEGGQATLRNPTLHSVIMELNGSGARYGYDESGILEMMFDHGFRTFAYDPLERRLRQISGRNPYSDNTLFIRNENFVRDSLASSPRVKIGGKTF